MSVSVKIDFSGLDKKLSGSNFKRAQQVMAQQVAMDSNQFVPADTLHLRNSQMVSPDGSEISWNTPYAGPQYYAPGGWHYTTPGTGPRWFDRAQGQFMASWVKAYKGGLNL